MTRAALCLGLLIFKFSRQIEVYRAGDNLQTLRRQNSCRPMTRRVGSETSRRGELRIASSVTAALAESAAGVFTFVDGQQPGACHAIAAIARAAQPKSAPRDLTPRAGLQPYPLT
jgi:hypothetical protein